jgi:hypothetical protein
MERACPRTQGLPAWAHRSAHQVPGAQACDADHASLSIGRQGREERFGGRLQMPGQQDRTGLLQDAHVAGARVQVNAPGAWLWRGVEAPEGSASAGR